MARGDVEVQMRSVGEYQGRPRDKTTPGIIIGTIDESVGGDGVITDGATQWMTAGGGILHIETPPAALVESGGLFHGLQLWINLPAAQKMCPPRYQDIAPEFGTMADFDAMLAAGFTPGEADALRRAMAAWKRKGGLGPFHERLVGRMVAKGYEPAYAERIFKQIEGFGEYGFPESHAASFALLVYVSAWLKCHHPDAFLAALLNSQPMGFYAPAQIVRDAREHGVEVRPVSVDQSYWDCTLEPRPDGQLALRSAINIAILTALRAHSVEIPYPQRVVHVHAPAGQPPLSGS